MGATLAAKGERRRALTILKKLKAAESRTEPAVLIAAIYAGLGLATEMYDWLERAVAVKSTPIYITVVSNEFDPYRTEARFHKFLASIGLLHMARN